MSWLESLKQKSAPVKAHIAMSTAFAVTLVIGLVWSTTLPARFAAVTESIDDTAVVDDAEGGFRSLVGSAKAQLGSVVSSIRGDQQFDDVYMPEALEESHTPVETMQAPAPVAVVTQEATTTHQAVPAPSRVLIATTTAHSSTTEQVVDTE
ncbi:MAG: hypothetical protein LR017_03675 [Candidatus Pacebacteria bacterium]|nr:hypothetical protein [Candidatus Paceibacterota bacterium]